MRKPKLKVLALFLLSWLLLHYGLCEMPLLLFPALLVCLYMGYLLDKLYTKKI